MLPEHIEAQILHLQNIIEIRQVPGRGIEPLRKIALIQHAVLEIRRIIQADPRVVFQLIAQRIQEVPRKSFLINPPRILPLYTEFAERKVSKHLIVKSRKPEIIQIRRHRAPQTSVGNSKPKLRRIIVCRHNDSLQLVIFLKAIQHAKTLIVLIAEFFRLIGAVLFAFLRMAFGKRVDIRLSDLNLKFISNSAPGDALVKGNFHAHLARNDIRHYLICPDIAFRGTLQPHGLPDAALGCVKHTSPFQELLPPAVKGGLALIPDRDDELKGLILIVYIIC